MKDKIKKVSKLPAGKYYIGDFCYLQDKLKDDSISYLLIQVILDEVMKPGMFEDEQTGVKFYFCCNFGGDGGYDAYINGKRKLTIGVDSGSLGAFPYPHASEFKKKKTLRGPADTLNRTFKGAFKCSEVKLSAGSYKGARNFRATNCVNECEIGDVTIVFDNFE